MALENHFGGDFGRQNMATTSRRRNRHDLPAESAFTRRWRLRAEMRHFKCFAQRAAIQRTPTLNYEIRYLRSARARTQRHGFGHQRDTRVGQMRLQTSLLIRPATTQVWAHFITKKNAHA